MRNCFAHLPWKSQAIEQEGGINFEEIIISYFGFHTTNTKEVVTLNSEWMNSWPLDELFCLFPWTNTQQNELIIHVLRLKTKALT